MSWFLWLLSFLPTEIYYIIAGIAYVLVANLPLVGKWQTALAAAMMVVSLGWQGDAFNKGWTSCQVSKVCVRKAAPKQKSFVDKVTEQFKDPKPNRREYK